MKSSSGYAVACVCVDFGIPVERIKKSHSDTFIIYDNMCNILSMQNVVEE